MGQFCLCKTVQQWSVWLFLLSLTVFGSSDRPLAAQTLNNDPPRNPALDLKLLEPGAQPDSDEVITAATIAQRGLTIPSLWWAKQQFGGRLLDNWLAYPNQDRIGGRVDLVVNRQIWSLLDYLQRYEFVNHFGTEAKDYRYNMRVFNRQGGLLAAYTCEFNVEPTVCRIWLDSSGFQPTRQDFAP